MTPGARIQATIELLDSILTSWQSPKRIPADKLIDNYFRARRFLGSKDRATIGELVYWCLRNKATMGYTGNATLAQMQKNCEFVRITGAGLRESHAHGVTITQEAPNYRAES